MGAFDRTIRLIGEEAFARLAASSVLLVGLGGVGSYACEALTRSGIGRLTLVDGDVVDETNLNRQLIATVQSVGMPKAQAARERAISINPNASIDARRVFYDSDSALQFDMRDYDYVIDAIDTVSSKILLIERAKQAGTRVITSMGAGNKTAASFEVADIADTSVCPLARRMRTELKKRGITGVKAVYSRDLPVVPKDGLRAPASISFVPGMAGLVIAGEVVRELAGL